MRSLSIIKRVLLAAVFLTATFVASIHQIHCYGDKVHSSSTCTLCQSAAPFTPTAPTVSLATPEIIFLIVETPQETIFAAEQLYVSAHNPRSPPLA